MSTRHIIFGLILVAGCFFAIGYFTRILTSEKPPSELPVIVRDSLYWKDVERSADSLFGTIDTIVKVDTVWLTKTRGYVTSLAPDSLIAIHLLPPVTRRADTTGNP